MNDDERRRDNRRMAGAEAIGVLTALLAMRAISSPALANVAREVVTRYDANEIQSAPVVEEIELHDVAAEVALRG